MTRPGRKSLRGIEPKSAAVDVHTFTTRPTRQPKSPDQQAFPGRRKNQSLPDPGSGGGGGGGTPCDVLSLGHQAGHHGGNVRDGHVAQGGVHLVRAVQAAQPHQAGELHVELRQHRAGRRVDHRQQFPVDS